MMTSSFVVTQQRSLSVLQLGSPFRFGAVQKYFELQIPEISKFRGILKFPNFHSKTFLHFLANPRNSDILSFLRRTDHQKKERTTRRERPSNRISAKVIINMANVAGKMNFSFSLNFLKNQKKERSPFNVQTRPPKK